MTNNYSSRNFIVTMAVCVMDEVAAPLRSNPVEMAQMAADTVRT